MKKLFIVIMALFITQYCHAKNIDVKTGLGYIKDQSGNIVSKMKLPKGIQPLSTGFDYFEVNTIEEFNAIQVYIEPESPQEIERKKKARRDQNLSDLGLVEKDLAKIKKLPDAQ
jgi:hypothetical protein